MSAPQAGRVLVTGGSGGIGRAVVELLTARGATVVAVGRDRDRLTELTAHAIVADLSDPSQRSDLVARAAEAMGGLDGLVQCAGVARHLPVGAITEEELSAQVAVNLAAPIMISQQAAVHMRDHGVEGSIVHVASTLGIRPAARTAIYAATKAGLIAATKALAVELAPDRIRVNAVAPGVVDTEMARRPRLEPGEPEPTGPERDRRVTVQLEELRALHPLGRLGTAAEVAAAILHLLDAPFTTGSVLVVDGGLLVG